MIEIGYERSAAFGKVFNRAFPETLLGCGLRTKIAVTLGPSCGSKEIVKELALEGVSAFRINFSHGSEEEWASYARLAREVEDEIGRHIALIGDLSGPSIRVGVLDEPITLKAGEQAYLVAGEKAAGGEEKVIPVPNERVVALLRKGYVLLMDDGRAAFRVEEADEGRVSLRAITEAAVTSRKTLVIQGKDLELPAVSERDVAAVRLAAEEGFDYLGLSYVRGSGDVLMLRGMLVSLGAEETGIIAKIETPAALRELEKIIDASDAVLVARGDLGMHFQLQEVPRLQEKIVKESIGRGKPVIVATQILGSMMESPVPTRSEIVDVVTAIQEGVDVLMLTGETAVGKYPVETVRWLRRILETYESTINPPEIELPSEVGIRERFASGIVSLAESLNAVIAVYTRSGRTALRLARCRPSCKIYAGSPSRSVLRKLAVVWGVEPLLVESKEYNEGLEELQVKLSALEEIKEGSIIVLTYGLREEPLHMVRIVQVARGEPL